MGRHGQTFKETLNRAVLKGLAELEGDDRKPFRVAPSGQRETTRWISRI